MHEPFKYILVSQSRRNNYLLPSSAMFHHNLLYKVNGNYYYVPDGVRVKFPLSNIRLNPLTKIEIDKFSHATFFDDVFTNK